MKTRNAAATILALFLTLLCLAPTTALADEAVSFGGADVTKDDLMTITAEDGAAARASDEKMIAAEKAQAELIQSAEETIAELRALSKDVKVKLDIPEGDEEPGNPEEE